MPWLAIALKLKSLSSGVIKFILDHPWPALSVSLGVCCGWLFIFTIPGLKADIQAEVLAHQETKQVYRDAQKEAARLAIQQRLDAEARYRRLSNESDQAIAEAYRTGLDAANDFISRSLREQARASAIGEASRAGTPAPVGSAGVPEGTSGLPELVGVSPSDIRICTINTIKLQQAQNWAASLAE